MKAETRIGYISIDWYKPYAEDRSFMTNIQLGRTLAEFYGKEAIQLSRELLAGGTFTTEKAREINDQVFRSGKKIYRLPKLCDAQDFFMQQQKGAIAAVKYFVELVPELAGEWELKDEITDLSDRPSDLLRLLSRPPGSIDPTLAYEALRHSIMLYQLGMSNARTKNSRLHTVKTDINRLLDEKLFAGPEGHGEKFFIESFHDDETNQVVGFPNQGDHRPLIAHLKRIPLTVREINGIGYVHTSSRKKDDTIVLLKSWIKAQENGGKIHLDEAVKDSMGRMYVLMDDSVPPEQLADLVVSTIESHAGSDLWEIPKITKKERDNKTGDDHGQSSQPDKPNLNDRWNIWFENIPTPYELIFYDRETYLNSRFEVGTRDSETGFYMGRGRRLFDLRRAWLASKIPFPQEIYCPDEYARNAAFVSMSKQIAYGLRMTHKASG